MGIASNVAKSITVALLLSGCGTEDASEPYATTNKQVVFDLIERASRTAAARIRFTFIEDCTLDSQGPREQGIYDITILENNFGLVNGEQRRVLSFPSGTIAGFDDADDDDWIVDFYAHEVSSDVELQEFPCGPIEDAADVYGMAAKLDVSRDATMYSVAEVDEMLLQHAPRQLPVISLGGDPPTGD